jgi:hypothetical protein
LGGRIDTKHGKDKSKKVSAERGMGKLLRSHSRWLTTLGPLIVLTTFIVKDHFRENLKNLGDSIDSAKSFFLVLDEVQNGNTALTAWMVALNERLNALVPGQYAIPTGATGPEIQAALVNAQLAQAEQDLSLAESGRRDTVDVLRNVEYLLAPLKNERATQQQADSLQGQLSNMSNRFKQIDKMIMDEQTAAKLKSDQQTKGGLPPQIFPAVWEVARQLSTVDRAVEKLKENVIADAEHERATAQAEYTACTWISNVLYFFGWCLGLLGSLFGVQGLAAEA